MAKASITYSMSENEFLAVDFHAPGKSPDQLYDIKQRTVELFREALALADESIDMDELESQFAEVYDTED